MCNLSSACEYIIEGHLLGEPTHADRSLSPNNGRPEDMCDYQYCSRACCLVLVVIRES
jgi:hypothetical protein